MPLHSIQAISADAVLGLWHLTETPADLWPNLPEAAHYQALLPATAPVSRQAQWLAGRVLVHALLAELQPSPASGLLMHNDADGRPWLAGASQAPAVSLSHSGAWVAAVLAQGGRVGVDVEMMRDKAQRLAGKFLSALELTNHQLIDLPPPAAHAHYTLLWSAKETLYKLAGQRGIIFKDQLLLSPFSPQEAGEIPATLVLADARTRHRICYFRPAPGYVLTYCHEPAA